jgi:hypothetical protein
MQPKKIELEILVKEEFEDRIREWFPGLEVNRTTDGFTCFRGPVPDQSALYGVLEKIHDFNLTLVSVKTQEAEEGEPHDRKKLKNIIQ